MDYEELVKRRNAANAFARLAGIRALEIREGWCRAVAEITKDSMNPVGSIHGGLLMTLADVACGGAASSRGSTVVTVNSDFHFLRPGTRELTELYGEAQEIKQGSRVLVFDVKVTARDETVLGRGTMTYMILN